jgi:hypothetical protein
MNKMMFTKPAIIGLAEFLTAALLLGQVASPEKDVIVFMNGERLVGHLESSNGKAVHFKSDTVGELSVDWSTVRELHSSQTFAVIPKNVELKNGADVSKIPQGTISVADQNITVTPKTGQPQTIAAADSDHLVDQARFDRAIAGHNSILTDWRGAITAGASLVQATQQSRNFTGAVSLVRISPDEDWLRRRNRTTVDFAAAYGTVEQPATPLVKTEIYHANVERDEFVSASVFGFGQATFDHNFSQGLDLQQTYGGGIGKSLIKRDNETLDVKAGLTYIRQSFQDASANQNLLGSIFEEDFQRGLRRGIKFTQQLIATPAWSNSDAVSAVTSALITAPVYKRLNLSFGAIDNYLHNPPPGFRKNSFQLTAGLAYTLQ